MIDYTKIEPCASHDPGQPSVELRLLYSMAVSLKRIADGLESGEIFQQPVNNYGESLTDAIQMSLVRGMRGIDTI